jgi:ribulose 1,5-bisphosphate synthetase/thiazole synthase
LGYCWSYDTKACDVVKNGKTVHSFDYIIVGSGPAGSTIADRLARANTARKVLLLESGADPNSNSVVRIKLMNF